MKQGDILIKGNDKRKVLGVCGEVVFLSSYSDMTRTGANVTATQLEQDGWTVEEQPWFPKYGEQIWHINSKGHVTEGKWTSSEKQVAKMEFLGIYKTKEAAKAALVEIRRKLGKVTPNP